MFNLQGSEIIVILLLALVVLGPEKLPDAIRKFSQAYSEFKKMGSGFQSELKSALDEPMREMRETADLVKRSADPARIAEEAENEAELRAAADAAAIAATTTSADDSSADTADDPTSADESSADTADDPTSAVAKDAPADTADELPARSTAYLPAHLRVSESDGAEPANGKKVNQIALSMARGPIEPDAAPKSDDATGAVGEPAPLTAAPEGAAASLAPPTSGTMPTETPPPPPSATASDDADVSAS